MGAKKILKQQTIRFVRFCFVFCFVFVFLSLSLTDLTDPSSEGDWQVPILFSYRFFVATIGHLGMICSLASQSILGASLLTMTRNNSAVNQSETLPAVAPVFVNDTVDSRVRV